MFSEYILILVWIGFLALLTRGIRLGQVETVCGEEVVRLPWWFAFMAFAPVIWMAGHRGYVGDTYAYLREFANMPATYSGLPLYVATLTKDKGFYIFSALLKFVIGNRPVWYLMFFSILQGLSLVSVFRKHSDDYFLSIFLFLASTDYISWMFNGLRQFVAVIIIFAATGLMLKKRYIPLILVIIFASRFHQSALIMIPLVIIAQGKAWNKRTLLFLGGALLAVAFVGRFTSLLDDSLQNTQYKNVISDYTEWNDDGTNPLRVAVYSVPALLSFVGRKTIQQDDNVVINFCTNMSIISAGLYIVSMFTSGIFMGRLPIYCSLYGYILLPWEVEHFFTPESRKVMYAAMIVAYLLFYYYQSI